MIENTDGMSFLKKVRNESVSLILTDPPYIISKDSGMQRQLENIDGNGKTEEDWNAYVKKNKNKTFTEKQKDNFLRYGTVLGKKYAYKSDFGEWDNSFTMETLDEIVGEYYKKLKKGGTLILWFDVYKLESLRKIFEKHKFKQLRIVQWVKSNPVPLNSKTNYLSNAIEYALLGIKESKPTFHGEYHTGIYTHPIQSGRIRFHPTMKSIQLFEDLIKTHTNEGDTVMDTFLGNGTTAIAAKHTKRKCIGCEVNKEYFQKLIALAEGS
jgi:site-specific DNA-methyltransferase (adenine-specific)